MNNKNKFDKKEEMINVKCSLCKNDMEMPKSFLEKGINLEEINHICDECADKSIWGDEKMKGFLEDVKGEMSKLDKNNQIAEDIADEITESSCQSLLAELIEQKLQEEELILESFYRGAWTALFIVGNNHEDGFLEKEAERIRDFNKKMREREKLK